MKSYPLRYILPAALLLIISMVVFSAGVMPGAPRPSDQTGGAQQFYEPYGRQVRALSPTGGSRYSADDDFIDWRRTTDRISSHTQDKEAVKITSGVSVKNDVSPPLRNMQQLPPKAVPEHEANENPKLGLNRIHPNYADKVIQSKASPNAMPTLMMKWERRSMCKWSTRVTRYLTRAPARRCWDLQVSSRSGPDSAAYARTMATVTLSCSLTNSPIAGSSVSSPEHRFQRTNALQFLRHLMPQAVTTDMTFTSAVTFSTILT